MEPKLIASLAALSGAMFVWVVFGVFWLRCKSKKFYNDIFQDAKPFQIRGNFRLLGVFFVISSVFLVSVFSVFIPSENVKPDDWIIALILGIFMGGLGGVYGAILFLARVYINSYGVLGLSVFGLPHSIAWTELNSVSYSSGMQSYKLKGTSSSVYVPEMIDGIDEFIGLLKKHVPSENIEYNLGANSHDYHSKKYFESVAKHSPVISKFLLVIISLSFFLLPPYVYAMFISAIAGVALSLGTQSVTIIWPNAKSYVYSVFNFIGLLGFMVISSISWSEYQEHLGGENNIDAYTWIFLMLQTLGTSMLFALLTLIFVRNMFLSK